MLGMQLLVLINRKIVSQVYNVVLNLYFQDAPFEQYKYDTWEDRRGGGQREKRKGK